MGCKETRVRGEYKGRRGIEFIGFVEFVELKEKRRVESCILFAVVNSLNLHPRSGWTQETLSKGAGISNIEYRRPNPKDQILNDGRNKYDLRRKK